MEKKNNKGNYNVKKKQHNREDRVTKENTTKQNKRVRGDTRTKERRWTSLRR